MHAEMCDELHSNRTNVFVTILHIRLLLHHDKSPILTISWPNAGYYRVNYDRHNWENIARCLDTDRDKFHETNRAQIMDDAFNLAREAIQ